MSRATNKFSWERALGESDLSPTARHVALRIACFMSKDGASAFPSVATLAKKTGYDPSTISRSVKELKRAGYLLVTPGGSPLDGKRTTNQYEAAIPEDRLPFTTTGTAQPVAHGNGSSSAMPLVAPRHATGRTVPHNQSLPDPDQGEPLPMADQVRRAAQAREELR
tara:strand:+ start:74 stop:571 length:498 start_codon:yes stop_codon:yes gene_type:complete